MTDSTEKWDKKNFRVKEQGDCLLHKKKQKQKQNKTKHILNYGVKEYKVEKR